MDGGFVSQSREQIHRDLFWTNQKLFFFFFQYDIWARYLQRRISEEYYEIFIYSCILIFFFFFFLYSPFNEYTCLHRYNGHGTTKIFFSRYPGDWIWIAWNIKVAFHEALNLDTWKNVRERLGNMRKWVIREFGLNTRYVCEGIGIISGGILLCRR